MIPAYPPLKKMIFIVAIFGRFRHSFVHGKHANDHRRTLQHGRSNRTFRHRPTNRRADRMRAGVDRRTRKK